MTGDSSIRVLINLLAPVLIALFRPVVDQSVEAAIRLLDAQRPKDAAGRILLDKAGAAAEMSVSQATIDRWREHYGLPCLKLDNGKPMFRPDALREWARQREGGAE